MKHIIGSSRCNFRVPCFVYTFAKVATLAMPVAIVEVHKITLSMNSWRMESGSTDFGRMNIWYRFCSSFLYTVLPILLYCGAMKAPHFPIRHRPMAGSCHLRLSQESLIPVYFLILRHLELLRVDCSSSSSLFCC